MVGVGWIPAHQELKTFSDHFTKRARQTPVQGQMAGTNLPTAAPVPRLCPPVSQHQHNTSLPFAASFTLFGPLLHPAFNNNQSFLPKATW